MARKKKKEQAETKPEVKTEDKVKQDDERVWHDGKPERDRKSVV